MSNYQQASGIGVFIVSGIGLQVQAVVVQLNLLLLFIHPIYSLLFLLTLFSILSILSFYIHIFCIVYIATIHNKIIYQEKNIHIFISLLSLYSLILSYIVYCNVSIASIINKIIYQGKKPLRQSTPTMLCTEGQV